MMQNNCPAVLVACQKHSPVHTALCRSLGEPLRPLGFDVRYLLPNSLRWTVPQRQMEHTFFIGASRNAKEILWDSLAALTWRRSFFRKLLKETTPSLLLFEASHPANHTLAALAKSMVPTVQTWMLLHEPYVKDKAKHGWSRTLSIAAHEWAVSRLLPYLDGVLVPSSEAERQMQAVYGHFAGTVLKTPLLFEDRFNPAPYNRRYFSFIGHAVPAKGIDIFFNLVESCSTKDQTWEFQIVTSTNISADLGRLSATARDRLHVVNKAQITDDEIDNAIRASWAILAPYRRVTQSGVVPVAFMHGTPIISTRVGGMPESVVSGMTGYLVDSEASTAEWEQRFAQVQENFRQLTTACRQYFTENFDARLGPTYLLPILNALPEPL